MGGISVMLPRARLQCGSAGSGAPSAMGLWCLRCSACSSCLCCCVVFASAPAPSAWLPPARPMSTWQLCSMAKRGNLAKSFGPKRWGLTLFSVGDRVSLKVVSSNSISAGSARVRFAGGWSSHRWICSSLPCPSIRLGLGRGGVVELVAMVVWLGCCCKARSRSGSALCCGQACQGMPHAHCHFFTNRDFRQLLHHKRVSRLLWWKAGRVPGSWCGHREHLKYITLGRGWVAVGLCCSVGEVLVLLLLLLLGAGAGRVLLCAGG